ncbi:MAG: hypothetical protein K9I85_04220 [Saprospiraceae bacterium]|nr:hypothetical protein [Saprospiraceae bacterium]
MFRYLFLIGLLYLGSACSPGKKAISTPVDDIQDLPEMVVTAEASPLAEPVLPPFKGSRTRVWDLLDTDLEIRFDWENSTAPGKAILTMTPLQNEQTEVILDAVGFQLSRVGYPDLSKPLAYTYDDQHLVVTLDRTFAKGDTLRLEIDYLAQPEKNQISPGRAVTSDKGLYFINPTGQYKDKPRQVWTQGETQANSRWVPTFDQANERATQTFHITVDTVFETLSNGVLTNSTVHTDGTRTDTWRMDLPHAPYLMMIAVGDFAIIRDSWQGIPLEYYVEPEFAADAKAIFPDVSAMLSFFSDYTGMAYPWSKLGQVPVRDYVSGAMENTTAIVHAESVQQTTRELIDEMRNEQVCAHEIFHQWFGDLVTCEQWSQTVLNEGFANYGEYLWYEFKYGRDAAELHRQEEFGGYLSELRRKRHPLVDYHYEDPDDMFDAHSYNKGGMVLHMLREELGEPTFRVGLKKYLEDNAFGAVEFHHLRLAMEAASGRDLNWFFNQWFLQPGHPKVNWDWYYNPAVHTLTVRTAQEQDPADNAEVYRLPTEIAVLLSRDRIVHFPMTMDEREQFFTFDLDEEPVLVDLDPERILIMEQERAEWTPQAARAYWRMRPSAWSRMEILDQLGPEVRSLEPYPWQDPQWQVRVKALDQIEEVDEVLRNELIRISVEDPHSDLRASAVAKLAEQEVPEKKAFLIGIIKSDPSYLVVATALQVLLNLDPAATEAVLEGMESDTSLTNILILSNLYARIEDTRHIHYILRNWSRVNGFARIGFTKSYIDLARSGDSQIKDEAIERLSVEAGSTSWTPLRRYAAFRALAVFRQHLLVLDPNRAEAIKTNLDKIKAAETDAGLLRYYNNY